MKKTLFGFSFFLGAGEGSAGVSFLGEVEEDSSDLLAKGLGTDGTEILGSSTDFCLGGGGGGVETAAALGFSGVPPLLLLVGKLNFGSSTANFFSASLGRCCCCCCCCLGGGDGGVETTAAALGFSGALPMGKLNFGRSGTTTVGVDLFVFSSTGRGGGDGFLTCSVVVDDADDDFGGEILLDNCVVCVCVCII